MTVQITEQNKARTYPSRGVGLNLADDGKVVTLSCCSNALFDGFNYQCY